jgi:hypothetical protein
MIFASQSGASAPSPANQPHSAPCSSAGPDGKASRADRVGDFGPTGQFGVVHVKRSHRRTAQV